MQTQQRTKRFYAAPRMCQLTIDSSSCVLAESQDNDGETRRKNPTTTTPTTNNLWGSNDGRGKLWSE